MLKFEDGFPRQRPEVRAEVAHLQRVLTATGSELTADGFFGQATEQAVKDFQSDKGIATSGIVDNETWLALERSRAVAAGAVAPDAAVAAALDAEHTRLPDLRGDLGWVHAREGHAGKPYWPGGESGVTLDPGFDLGYQERDTVKQHYQPLLNSQQFESLGEILGIRGRRAKQRLNQNRVLLSIRISREDALEIMPAIALPYWNGIARRFPALRNDTTLPQVQTVLLSLAFNRGIKNPDLEQLAAPIDSGDWADVARRVGRMQQDHRLRGIRKRRRLEAQLIAGALRA